jgi:hypothetical protein
MKRTLPLQEAVARIPNGAVVMAGGFMGVGSPQHLIGELVRHRTLVAEGKCTLDIDGNPFLLERR